MYAEDWESVARHVGPLRTAEDCVKCFVQIPIADAMEGATGDGHRASRCAPRGRFDVAARISKAEAFVQTLFPAPPSGERLPFDDVPNPILAQLAFLSSKVDPLVAAAAAKAALQALQQRSAEREEGTGSPEGAAPDADAVSGACAVAMAAAAVRARELMTSHDSQIRSLTSELVEAKIQQLELRLQQFDFCSEVLRIGEVRPGEALPGGAGALPDDAAR
eukprot:Polyplicarium_translucidae@DN2749_c0_g1_i4.p1